MKLIVELTNINLIKKYLKIDSVSYLMVGYRGLSLNSNALFNYEEIVKINDALKNSSVGLILNCERLFSDYELANIDELIEKNFFENFNYVTYSDFGLKSYLENKGVNIKFIYKAHTYLTNYLDVNEYNKINDYVFVSSEISSEELIDLTKKVNKPVIVDIFGQSACFYSRRELISRYFEYRGIDKDSNKTNYYVVEELRSDFLPIIENEVGTVILEPKFHVLAEEIEKLENIEFGYIGLNKLNQKTCIQVVEAYTQLLSNHNVNNFYNLLNNMKLEYYKGAYNIKSVLLKGGDCNE